MSSYYNSSTHGRIPMSGRGRQLFQSLRRAAEDAIRVSYWGANNNALSKARGELALYVSELEKFRDGVLGGPTQVPQTRRWSIEQLRAHCAALVNEYVRSRVNGRDDVIDMLRRRRARCVNDLDYAGLLALERQLTETNSEYAAEGTAYHWVASSALDESMRALLAITQRMFYADDPASLFTSPKEKTTMNEETPKKRSDLLAAASVELCKAQRDLESLDTVRTLPAPPSLATLPIGNGPLSNGMGALAVERWDEMRDEVIHRAEVRVWETENAVAALLGVERDAPKPRKPRTKSKKD